MEHAEQITVLAGGYSASSYDLATLPGIVIAVNDSAYYSPRWDVAVSMDRLWAENRFEWLQRQHKPVYLRASTIKNFSIADHPRFISYECDHTTALFSDDEYMLNGRHSGAIALNLAYLMRPKKLWIVGMDLKLGPRGERHWHPDYPWKAGGGSKSGTLLEWSREREQQLIQLRSAGIDVTVCDEVKKPRSAVLNRLRASGAPP